MIAVLDVNCPLQVKAEVVRLAETAGLLVHVSETTDECLIGFVGEGASSIHPQLIQLPGVREVRTDAPPYLLVSRAHRPSPTLVRVGTGFFGGDAIQVIAGPCSVESQDQVSTAARGVQTHGAIAVRGGAFKPRTSPYSFHGLGEEGLKMLAAAREETGLPVVTEVMSPMDVDLVASYADVLQIGARNMQNYPLLRAVGKQRKPVLLKRGMSGTIDEFLLAAEYVVSSGNPRVILCERGIRTFSRATRNTLDISAIPVLKERTHLPVIVDPSHAAGLRAWVRPFARAAIAAGADGLIVEVHPNPKAARSDASQQLTVPEFGGLMDDVRRIAEAVGRKGPM